MIKYYKLFDLLNRRGKKKTDLLEIISSKTLAKLSKGENVNSEVIDKICLYLNCQPNDIMEIFKVREVTRADGTIEKILIKTDNDEQEEFEFFARKYLEQKEKSYSRTKKQIEKNEDEE